MLGIDKTRIKTEQYTVEKYLTRIFLEGGADES